MRHLLQKMYQQVQLVVLAMVSAWMLTFPRLELPDGLDDAAAGARMSQVPLLVFQPQLQFRLPLLQVLSRPEVLPLSHPFQPVQQRVVPLDLDARPVLAQRQVLARYG